MSSSKSICHLRELTATVTFGCDQLTDFKPLQGSGNETHYFCAMKISYKVCSQKKKNALRKDETKPCLIISMNTDRKREKNKTKKEKTSHKQASILLSLTAG